METTILFPHGHDLLQEGDHNEIRPFSIYNSDTSRRRELYMIVAAGADRAIGRAGNLIWRLPEDLPNFKRLTMGHPVIMGRKTFESLPKGALPGRRNIVVTSNSQWSAPRAERASSPEEAVAMCDGTETPFVIGGGHIYKALLPYATRLFITQVDGRCEDADTFFPEIDTDEWQLIESSPDMHTPDGIAYRFLQWRRRNG